MNRGGALRFLPSFPSLFSLSPPPPPSFPHFRAEDNLELHPLLSLSPSAEATYRPRPASTSHSDTVVWVRKKGGLYTFETRPGNCAKKEAKDTGFLYLSPSFGVSKDI